MRRIAGQTTSYLQPLDAVRWYLADPFKLALILLTTFILGYGAHLDNSSPLTASALERLVGSFGIVEFTILVVPVLELIRRIAVGDPWLNRSSVTRAMLWVGIVLVVYPYLHMTMTEQAIRIPWEIVALPLMVLSFFIWLFTYRPEDLYLMVWMIMIAGFYKSIEAFSVYATVGLMWGLLTGWRDAMILTMMILGSVLAYVVKPGDDPFYARIRKFLLWTLPITGLAFAGCLRRSFIIGFVLCVLVLLFALNRDERRSLRVIMTVVIGVVTAGLFIVDISNFLQRFANIIAPQREGSAAYRVLEFYNTTTMIMERPLTGWPMGKDIINYTILDYEVLSQGIPHNSYLYSLLRAGIFGLLTWLWMLGSMCSLHLRTIRAAGRPFERFVALWLAGGTVLIIFTGFTTPVFVEHLQVFYPFLMVMASFLPGAWVARRRFVPAFERA